MTSAPPSSPPPPPRWVDTRVASILEALDARGLMPDVLEVAEHYHVPVRELVGQARSRTVAMARRHVYLRLRERHGMSYPEIGKLFGRDHSTVIYGCRLAAHERKEECEP